MNSSQVTEKLQELQEDIDTARGRGLPVQRLNDGFHSFNDLYAHRIDLFICVCRQISANTYKDVWVTKTQSDGTPVQEGWLLLGINKKPGKQITYHIPADRLDECKKFAKELPKAPEFDGHTSADVLTRLKEL